MSLFGRSSSLNEIQDWLKTLPAHKMEAVSCGGMTLDGPVVKAIEEAVEEAKVQLRRN